MHQADGEGRRSGRACRKKDRDGAQRLLFLGRRSQRATCAMSQRRSDLAWYGHRRQGCFQHPVTQPCTRQSRKWGHDVPLLLSPIHAATNYVQHSIGRGTEIQGTSRHDCPPPRLAHSTRSSLPRRVHRGAFLIVAKLNPAMHICS